MSDLVGSLANSCINQACCHVSASRVQPFRQHTCLTDRLSIVSLDRYASRSAKLVKLSSGSDFGVRACFEVAAPVVVVVVVVVAACDGDALVRAKRLDELGRAGWDEACLVVLVALLLLLLVREGLALFDRDRCWRNAPGA